MKREIIVLSLLASMAVPDHTTRAATDAPPLRLVRTIPLPGVAGRIDHLALDRAGQRLFVAALGNNTVEVIDLKKAERDGALGAYDVAKGIRLADVPLDAHPESFQLDAASGRIFVNVASLQKVAVVDARRNAVAATWPVKAGAANFPMALDAAHHRLFVVTRRPPRVVVFDTETGNTVATLEADGDADDLFFDATQRRLFVAVPHRANPTAEIRVFDTGDPGVD